MGHKVIHKGAKAGGRRQKAEGRRQKAEGGRQKNKSFYLRMIFLITLA
jgi:hypothetical protein